MIAHRDSPFEDRVFVRDFLMPQSISTFELELTEVLFDGFGISGVRYAGEHLRQVVLNVDEEASQRRGDSRAGRDDD